MPPLRRGKQHTSHASRKAKYRKEKATAQGLQTGKKDYVPPSARLQALEGLVKSGQVPHEKFEIWSADFHKAVKGQKPKHGGLEGAGVKKDTVIGVFTKAKGGAVLKEFAQWTLQQVFSARFDVQIEGIDTPPDLGSPWMLKGEEGDGAVHHDLARSRGLPDTGNHDTWSLLLCLDAEAPYTFRVFERVQKFKDLTSLGSEPHKDATLRKATWVLFPAKQQHMVVAGAPRTIVNMVFNAFEIQ
jgi:hypothetical protein